MKRKRVLFAGKPSKSLGKYKFVELEATVGKTVEAISAGHVEGPNGDEECIYLHFKDGTSHGFVMPSND